MIRKYLIIPFLLILLTVVNSPLKGQDNEEWRSVYDSTAARLRRVEKVLPGLEQKINISITETTLNEFLRAVANSSGINMNISPDLNQRIVNNFSDVKISDVLLFLCNQYRLHIIVVGNIIDISQYNQPAVKPVCIIDFSSAAGKLTVEADGEELGLLSKKITLATGFNVIPAPGLNSQKITAFVLALPLPDALDKIAYSNGLVIKSTENNVFLFEKKVAERADVQSQRNDNNSGRIEKDAGPKLVIKILGEDSLSIFADRIPVVDLIKALSEKTGNSYMFSVMPKGEVTTFISGVSYKNAMNTILKSSGLSCKVSDNIYIIGDQTTPDLMVQKMVQLQYRSVDSILTFIPKDVLHGIQVIEYREQNSLLLSGLSEKVDDAEKFIISIDVLVPVVSIEVLIIDYTKTITDETGFKAGLGTAPVAQTTGDIFPYVNMTLSSESINSLISRFNGFGWAKIGQVTPNFYASLKALEYQGIVKIRSTPILSTLNGHQAILSIGQTEYYVEESYNIYSTTSTQTQTIKTYKAVDANLAVTITPHVSGDDQITLDIVVEQSDFTTRISETAPPGEITRTFKSQIRVKNGEMILLGGLEENRKDKVDSGTPLISRIPVLKWIFSSRKDSDTSTKLNIFIKPSIIK